MLGQKRLLDVDPDDLISFHTAISLSTGRGQTETVVRAQKRPRQHTPSPRRHTPSPQLAVNLTQSFRSPPAFLSESNIRTACGASTPLDLTDCPRQTRKEWNSGLFSSSPYSSHWSSNSASPLVDIHHSTPTKRRDQRLSFVPSSDGKPSIYQHPNATTRSERQENNEIILGITSYPSPRYTHTSHFPKPTTANGFHHIISGLNHLRIRDQYTAQSSESLSRSTSSRSAMTLQTPPSGSSKRSFAIYGDNSERNQCLSLTSPAGVPRPKQSNFPLPLTNAEESPLSLRQCRNRIPERILALGKPMADSDSDSGSEIDVVMQEPTMILGAYGKIYDNSKQHPSTDQGNTASIRKISS
ncbi:hypothetical protein C343_04171 [Cryptococcus neoformans C23]|uniref:Uncharacterized protein n=1 Tax=Cryptococcus neoformans (strain H99 / ATCC 208821 / CBS 10515 / FGSC 9487) TaxID=235443 RepID=J9VRM5_CRYN9|nr:hypothetical protein CNAG_05738 [Cryptococcus neoformans var. grubii H99]AUB25924.1 hypothetical protein CKF44_05738 [Cryptococcus neoformans var. grubii]OWZ30472.1 hypothetical protein C347_04231 [Cryptococcus neoformans var. grubii AD2-60a]OWZ39357.1 hypothetical protein C353_04079 [Cryptococcus neoformans var. grubii AD1-83a]OWZ42245.1 hypothetical protein C343_04171 [Cryptococcus neoformans var. grubii C23]OXC83861.1 hypothetical protein C344_03926 [Cryptococcus neoformans var. grubii A|eukprot:XP_012050352.1 hypothetical protein CNAG_05738 [Cryptococcus neoformans var. grubii H99]